jgi:hypothetical protein
VLAQADAGDNSTDARGNAGDAGADTRNAGTSDASSAGAGDGREIISGLRDPDIRLVERESTGDTAVLTIESDVSKSIEVADVLAGADSQDGVGFVTTETRSLSPGTNRVEVEAATVNGKHMIGVKGDGPQANIMVEASGTWNTPDVGGATGAGGVVLALLAVSYVVTWLVQNVVRKDLRRVS